MSYAFDLGSWTRSVSASNAAQRWFDCGLNWLYGYNHEEAVICFRHALCIDARCAMAWWGIAYASGAFYNRSWLRFTDAEIAIVLPVCVDAAQAAMALSEDCAPADRALINALALRYQRADVVDRGVLDVWHREFTDAMREVYELYPDDLDVAALFAEAAVTCTPRLLWNLQTGLPNPDALTQEVLEVLERGAHAIEKNGVKHPGILHMTIHALEMSPFPERALRAADLLCGYAPDAGHLEHMPAHIYVLCGDYAQGIEQSRRAVMADNKYVTHAGVDNFYSTSRCHDFHLFMYAAMFVGQFHTALVAAQQMSAVASDDLLEASEPFMRSILDGYSAMLTHVFVRFGKWRELTAAPVPERRDLAPIRFAMHAYGKGVGHANLGEFEQARSARHTLHSAMREFASTDVFLSNPVADMLAVGVAMLDGELSYHEGDHTSAFESLRQAVSLDDRLNYTEPWAWMHPPRHALGALLAEQGWFAQAEAVFRADLGYRVEAGNEVPRCCTHPDNVWGLHGLHECLVEQGKTEEADLLKPRLAIAMARTDVQVKAACCCRST